MPLITCKDLALAYENDLVLCEVNFSIEPGDYLCVVGENGSGKSTLIKSLVGLLKPVRGEIVYGDGLRPGEVGYLPQQSAANRAFPASVWEVVLSGCLNRLGARPFYGRAEKRRAEEAMRLLGVWPLRGANIGALSGGQRQRTLLARALCAADKLLVLDEPAAGLDPLVTVELYELVRTLNRERGIAVVMISHDLPSALANANRILHLKQRQIFFGSCADYRQSAAYKSLGGESR